MNKILFVPLKWKDRIVGLAIVIASSFIFLRFFALSDEYYEKTENADMINPWGGTQQFVSRGFIYPFIYSSKEAEMKKPEEYSEEEAREILLTLQDDDIPSHQKINVIAIMLEAFGDFSEYAEIDFNLEENPYAAFHRIAEESYSGQLITNIFAGGTVATERRFITGADNYPNIRKKTCSYARYFESQGYKVEGSHPCYQWFYNRVNVNEYLGFSKYDYYESRYGALAHDTIADDSILFNALIEDLEDSIHENVPYFNFSVTYQNHGPYAGIRLYDETYINWKENYTEEGYNILNNYLHGIKDTGEELEKLTQRLNEINEPCVLIVFGDHKPWLGDDNSVYKMLGINLDVDSEEGFYNYYSTPYLIWANQPAKQVLNDSFCGIGPTIAPNYLMNEFFELAGFGGPAFMKVTNELKKVITAHSSGLFVENGKLTNRLSQQGFDAWTQYKKVEYYYMNQNVE